MRRRSVSSGMGTSLADGLREVADEVAHRLDADREAHEARRRRELGPADRGVRHGERHLDERLHAAERFAEREDLGPCGHTLRRRLAAAELERHHTAELAHLASRAVAVWT